METASGEMVYCLNPDKPAPKNGTYSTDDNHLQELTSSTLNYSLLRKALYYCYGGVGFEEKQSAFNNKTMKAYMGDLKSAHWLGASSSTLHFLLTHISLSYISGYENWNRTGYGDPFLTDWQNAVKELTSALKNAPDVPITTKLYVLTIDNNTQQVIIQKNSLKLQMQKTSSNTALTNNNSCYSLEGARYNLYLDSACKNYFGYITTDKTGYGKYGAGINGVDVSEKTYYAKEVEAPKGFALDTKVYILTDSGKTVDGSKIYSFTCSDTPLNDPAAMMVKKIDGSTGEETPLANAECTIKFYNDYYDTVSDLPDKATRTWVLKTDTDGRASLRASYLVSGDEFYYATDSGNPALPLGTITIQETKAPDGFDIDNTIYLSQLTAESGASTAKFETITITDVPKKPSNGYASVHKTDNEIGANISSAKYGIYTSNETDSSGNLLAKNYLGNATTAKSGVGVFNAVLEVEKNIIFRKQLHLKAMLEI